ncbi:MAG: oligosaccharide flippase family protein [Phycisphaerales bacterium]|jgi:O-antigen/teichoic acid export membrane protein
MNLSVLKKKSAKDLFVIFISTFSNQIVGLVRGFFVAKYLGPSDFGLLKAAQLIVMLNKFGNLGFKSAATREVGHFKGARQLERADRAKSAAYSGEFLLASLFFLIGVCSSLFFESFMLVAVILLASGQLFISKILGIYNTEAVIEKKIFLYSNILFWPGLISSLAIIAVVPFLKIYAVLGISILATLISCMIYKKTIGTNVKFDVYNIDKTELIRLLRIGFPLTLASLAYGSYRYSERILVGSLLGLEALGFYSLAMMPMDCMLNLLLLPVKVRKVNINELLGQNKLQDVHKMVIKETIAIFTLALISIPLLWFAVDILISLLLSGYTEAILASKILLLALPFRAISGYFNTVLVSSVVNKQILLAPMQFISVTVFVLSVLVLRYFDMASLTSIAIADVAGYAVVHLGSIAFYKKYFMNVYLKGSN